jgi:hypothetical protein
VGLLTLFTALPAGFSLTVLLCCASMRAEVYWGMGDTAKALECARKYTSICKQIESRIRYVSSTHLPYGNKILHVLLYLNEIDLLATQLDLFLALFELYSSWRETRDYYQQKILERKKRREQELAWQSTIQEDEMQRLKREVEQWHQILNGPETPTAAVSKFECGLPLSADTQRVRRGDTVPLAALPPAAVPSNNAYRSAVAAARFLDTPPVPSWPAPSPPKPSYTSSPASSSGSFSTASSSYPTPPHFLPASAPSFSPPYPTMATTGTTTTVPAPTAAAMATMSSEHSSFASTSSSPSRQEPARPTSAMPMAYDHLRPGSVSGSAYGAPSAPPQPSYPSAPPAHHHHQSPRHAFPQQRHHHQHQQQPPQPQPRHELRPALEQPHPGLSFLQFHPTSQQACLPPEHAAPQYPLMYYPSSSSSFSSSGSPLPSDPPCEVNSPALDAELEVLRGTTTTESPVGYPVGRRHPLSRDHPG